MIMSGSPEQARILFGFEAGDWLYLAGGVALTAVIAAVFAL
jgi:hypothetical protein